MSRRCDKCYDLFWRVGLLGKLKDFKCSSISDADIFNDDLSKQLDKLIQDVVTAAPKQVRLQVGADVDVLCCDGIYGGGTVTDFIVRDAKHCPYSGKDENLAGRSVLAWVCKVGSELSVQSARFYISRFNPPDCDAVLLAILSYVKSQRSLFEKGRGKESQLLLLPMPHRDRSGTSHSDDGDSPKTTESRAAANKRSKKTHQAVETANEDDVDSDEEPDNAVAPSPTSSQSATPSTGRKGSKKEKEIFQKNLNLKILNEIRVLRADAAGQPLVKTVNRFIGTVKEKKEKKDHDKDEAEQNEEDEADAMDQSEMAEEDMWFSQDAVAAKRLSTTMRTTTSARQKIFTKLEKRNIEQITVIPKRNKDDGCFLMVNANAHLHFAPEMLEFAAVVARGAARKSAARHPLGRFAGYSDIKVRGDQSDIPAENNETGATNEDKPWLFPHTLAVAVALKHFVSTIAVFYIRLLPRHSLFYAPLHLSKPSDTDVETAGQLVAGQPQLFAQLFREALLYLPFVVDQPMLDETEMKVAVCDAFHYVNGTYSQRKKTMNSENHPELIKKRRRRKLPEELSSMIPPRKANPLAASTNSSTPVVENEANITKATGDKRFTRTTRRTSATNVVHVQEKPDEKTLREDRSKKPMSKIRPQKANQLAAAINSTTSVVEPEEHTSKATGGKESARRGKRPAAVAANATSLKRTRNSTNNTMALKNNRLGPINSEKAIARDNQIRHTDPAAHGVPEGERPRESKLLFDDIASDNVGVPTVEAITSRHRPMLFDDIAGDKHSTAKAKRKKALVFE